MNKSKTLIASALCAVLMISGCAGRTPNPIIAVRADDSARSCQSLKSELSEIEHEIQVRLPKQDKTGKNVALGITGLFLWPAWLFMDFKDAEKIEINAYRERYNHLARICNDKSCYKVAKKELPDWFAEKPKG